MSVEVKQMSHTPTPWETDYLGDIIVDGRNGTVCQFLSDRGEDFPNKRANAEFICQAVNAHDELLAALQVAREAIQKAIMTEDGLDDWLCGLDGGEGSEALKRIDAALQKAEGK